MPRGPTQGPWIRRMVVSASRRPQEPSGPAGAVAVKSFGTKLVGRIAAGRGEQVPSRWPRVSPASSARSPPMGRRATARAPTRRRFGACEASAIGVTDQPGQDPLSHLARTPTVEQAFRFLAGDDVVADVDPRFPGPDSLGGSTLIAPPPWEWQSSERLEFARVEDHPDQEVSSSHNGIRTRAATLREGPEPFGPCCHVWCRRRCRCSSYSLSSARVAACYGVRPTVIGRSIGRTARSRDAPARSCLVCSWSSRQISSDGAPPPAGQ